MHLYRVGLSINGFKGFLYTGKFVKSLLVRILPEKEELFKPSKTGSPKLIHISPLYTSINGRIRCIYSSIRCSRKDSARCRGPLEPVELNGSYFFYIGFHDRTLDNGLFIERISELDGCFEFMDQKVCVSLNELEYVNPETRGMQLAEKVVWNGKLKIIFSSPTMLRDPFKRTKHKSLLPTVFNVFSTPLFLILYLQGEYSLKKLRRQLLILHRLFNESYSVIKTVKLKWIKYKRRPEPTIVGYMNLYLNEDYLKYYARYINMVKYLGEIFATMTALGVGVGRAAGFGHVFLEPGRIGDED